MPSLASPLARAIEISGAIPFVEELVAQYEIEAEEEDVFVRSRSRYSGAFAVELPRSPNLPKGEADLTTFVRRARAAALEEMRF